MHIQGKTFVVTGAGGGIGSELVKLLIKKGAKVAAVDLSEKSLEELFVSIGAEQSKLSTHSLNITNSSDVSNLPKTIEEIHGTIDGLINCAGIIQPFVKINNLDIETIRRVMDVNFYGTVNMTKAFLPKLLERNEAHIANVSSMGGFLPVPGQGVYGASKAAVKLMTESLYAELLDTPVRVSVVYPGATNTNITQNSNVTTPEPKGAAGGKDLSGMMLPASKSAEQIIKGIEKNKLHIYTGKDSKLMSKLYRLNPVFATKLIAKQMKSLLG